MKLWCLLTSLLVVFSCSTNKKIKKDIYDEPEAAQAPEWVYAPDQACDAEIEICAAGEGESMGQADMRAKKALASVFKTKIDSQLDTRKTSYSDEEISEIKEVIEIQVGEAVSEILKSVEINKRFQKDGLFFALASLDKQKAAESLNREVAALDNELAHLFKLKRKSAIKRMLGLLEKRAHLADKLLVIKGKASRAPYSFSDIQNIKFSSQGQNKVFLKIGKNVPATLFKHFKQTLVESGYEVHEDMAVDYILDLRYEAKEIYLNVKGFKNYDFMFSVEAKNNLNERIGFFSLNQEQTGRSKQDAYLKVKNFFQSEIDQKFNLLNLK
ncbi:MAG: hypothetical protein WEB87_02000 [Bacteriovoracaceae bacterium]